LFIGIHLLGPWNRLDVARLACPRSPDVHYDSAAKVGPRPDLASQKDNLNVDLGQIADTFRGVQVVLPPGRVPRRHYPTDAKT
jgi:hypothetical protein